MSYASAQDLIRESMAVMRPVPFINLADFAEKFRNLSSKNSALPGKFRLRYTPYLREILECYTDPEVEYLIMLKSSQVAWTDGVLNNILAYCIAHDPSSMLIMFPTEDMAKRYSKNKLDAMIEDNPWLAKHISPVRSRDSKNTALSKHFKGGHLELVGSNASSKLASDPVKRIFIEEPSRCALDSGGEGDSLAIVIERSKTFEDRKIVMGGSPTIRGQCPTEREFEGSDQRFYHTPCPECKELILLDLSLIKWGKSKIANHPVYGQHLPETAKIECPHCGYRYNNDIKIKTLRDGIWQAKREFDGRAGFFLNELLSPFPKATLSHVVAKFLKAKRAQDRGDHRQMITFENQSLGNTWEIKGDKVEHEELYQSRRHEYGPELHEDALIITAGVDVQKNRLEYEIIASSQERETWQLEYGVLEGDPAKRGVWDDLDSVLLQSWQHPYGSKLRIVAACIDEGGHHTTEVRKFCKARVNRRIFSTRGQGGPGLPFIHRVTDRNPERCRVHTLGVDSIKSLIMDQLRINEHGPGYCHFPMSRTEQYFSGLCSEIQVAKYVNGYKRFVFQKEMSGARNEPLDCRAYALAAVEIINPIWPQIADNVKPKDTEIKAVDPYADDDRDEPFVPSRNTPARGRRRPKSNVSKYRRPKYGG